MYSTTTLSKNSKLTGKIVGTHQQMDQAARKVLMHFLSRGKYFPSSKEIIHFEGTRGPDGLKRKSPGEDEPSHLLMPDEEFSHSGNTKNPGGFADSTASNRSAESSVVSTHQITLAELKTYPLTKLILDHRWNLVQALREHDEYRAAFEAAWMAHYLTDGLTPAHHFPFSSAREELMTNKEFVKIFGEPIKGIMHGRNSLETARNNWLYWGAGGIMTKHVAFEYGVVTIAMSLPQRKFMPQINPADFQQVDPAAAFHESLMIIRELNMYDEFRQEGWTTQLAFETKDVLLPEIIRATARLWYSAAAEAYGLEKNVCEKS